jgi:predicted O-linked N-acetylglucosamine transferase (SPINDLY family)
VTTPALAARIHQIHAQIQEGKFEAAHLALQRLLPKAQHLPDVHAMLAQCFMAMGRNEPAAFAARRAIELANTDPQVVLPCANTLACVGYPDEADAAVSRVLAADASHAGAHLWFANRALDRVDPAAALAHCEAAMRSGADEMVLLSYLGALLQCGRVSEAAQRARDGARDFPHNELLHSAAAQTLNALDDANPADIAAAHRAYGVCMRARMDASGPSFAAAGSPLGPWLKPGMPRDPGCALRVGFVTGDARVHSCAFFLLPVLEGLAARRRAPAAPTSAPMPAPAHDSDDAGTIETFLYATNRQRDAMTRRLEAAADHACDASLLSDLALARRVRDDRVHVLIDLMGHTLGTSLGCFAMRPAPVQATFLGYPNTTGLAEIDWRIIDGATDPAGDGPWGPPRFDARATERLYRLDPCFLCYRPPSVDVDAAQEDNAGVVVPEPTWSTALARREADAPVVFGSFNASTKYSDGTFRAWAAAMSATPRSRLVLKAGGLSDPLTRARVTDALGRLGIAPDRIEFMQRTRGIREHLAAYARVDIALDTFPYNGTTTTCEALWMGVPVVTIAGRTHAARVGVSLLRAVGTPELVAPESAAPRHAGLDPAHEADRLDEFGRLCADLAQDHARLAAYRAGLRTRMAASPLCDEAGFTARFARAVRSMWRDACAAEAR